MTTPAFDKEKLPQVMELIEQAASLMEQEDCNEDPQAAQELAALQQRMREVTGKQDLNIRDFQEYWSYTDLKTIAKSALLSPPQKSSLSDAEIKEIVVQILDYDEAEMEYWLKTLKINTGLRNLTDYIFYPDLLGLDKDASLSEIADKIISDKKTGVSQG